MHLNTAMKRLDRLTEPQLRTALRQCEQAVTDYEAVIVNYPPARMEKYGRPYMASLVANVELVKRRLVEVCPSSSIG